MYPGCSSPRASSMPRIAPCMSLASSTGWSTNSSWTNPQACQKGANKVSSGLLRAAPASGLTWGRIRPALTPPTRSNEASTSAASITTMILTTLGTIRFSVRDETATKLTQFYEPPVRGIALCRIVRRPGESVVPGFRPVAHKRTRTGGRPQPKDAASRPGWRLALQLGVGLQQIGRRGNTGVDPIHPGGASNQDGPHPERGGGKKVARLVVDHQVGSRLVDTAQGHRPAIGFGLRLVHPLQRDDVDDLSDQVVHAEHTQHPPGVGGVGIGEDDRRYGQPGQHPP